MPIAPINHNRKTRRSRLELAKELNVALCENEETMPEGAAYAAACERLGIDPADGWDYLVLLEASLEDEGEEK